MAGDPRGRSFRCFSTLAIAISGLLAASVSLASPAGASPASVGVVLSQSGPDPVAAGDTLTYDVTVSNSGTSDSNQVSITDTLPGYSYYVFNSATCGSVPNCTVMPDIPAASCASGVSSCQAFGGTITWTLSSVAAGASGLVLSYQVGLGMDVQAGLGSFENPSTLTNSASWTGNGCSSSSGCATNQVSDPFIALSASIASQPPNGTPVSQGQRIDYTVTITNTGDGSAGPLAVYDNLWSNNANEVPPGYVSGSASCGSSPGCSVSVGPAGCLLPGTVCLGTDVQWSLSSLAPHTSIELTVAFKASPGTTGTSGNAVQWVGTSSGKQAFYPGSGVGPYVTDGDGCVFLVVAETVFCQSNSVSSPVTVEKPVPQVTSPHTGEPWAGSKPIEEESAAVGFGLLFLGLIRRRKFKTNTVPPVR